MLAQAYSCYDKHPIEIFTKTDKIVFKFNSREYSGDTLDQCIADVKQSLAIQYLEQLRS